MLAELSIRTTKRTEFVDITRLVQEQVAASKIKNGICYVYVPHTTAGVTINEHADPDVVADMEMMLEKLVPWRAGYAHAEGNSAAHIKTSMIGSSQMIIVQEGRLLLGTWQGIFFAEFDGPRSREVWVKVTAD